MKNWTKLDLFYIGQSKKHQIFRAKKWSRDLEKILKKSIYDENYDHIGQVKDIFGPIERPFISIKTLSNQEFNSNASLNLYAKIT
jgi:rRNA processing protein Gar1